MRKGAEFEKIAENYLRGLGYQILHRNYHCRYGEIDLIVLDGSKLVFVEVKGGSSDSFADPLERIDRVKLEKIIICIEHFLQRHPAEDFRFDVILVRGKKVEHIKGVELF